MSKTSQFFSSKRTKACNYYRAGVSLYLRNSCIGSIRQDKATGLFYVAVVNSNDVLFNDEFKSFLEADQFAWISATSSAKKAAAA